MWVRFVLVPGLTDITTEVEKAARVCAGLKSLERVEILKFHQMGEASGPSSASSTRWRTRSRRRRRSPSACASSSAAAG